MFQFLGAKDAWLSLSGGESYKECVLATCPSINNNYRHFNGHCWGEEFQIIGEGAIHSPIKSGQRIRLRYLHVHNTWMGCPTSKNNCKQISCPGTTSQASNFSRCNQEILRIYSRGKRNGEIVHNDDTVMIYNDYTGKYISIQGQKNGDLSSLNFCPGVAPPAYLSYGICSKNVFRIYRKP